MEVVSRAELAVSGPETGARRRTSAIPTATRLSCLATRPERGSERRALPVLAAVPAAQRGQSQAGEVDLVGGEPGHEPGHEPVVSHHVVASSLAALASDPSITRVRAHVGGSENPGPTGPPSSR